MFAENKMKIILSVDKHTPEQMLALDSNIYTNNIILHTTVCNSVCKNSFYYYIICLMARTGCLTGWT